MLPLWYQAPHYNGDSSLEANLHFWPILGRNGFFSPPALSACASGTQVLYVRSVPVLGPPSRGGETIPFPIETKILFKMLMRSKFTGERPREGEDPVKSVHSAFSSTLRLTLSQSWKFEANPHFRPNK